MENQRKTWKLQKAMENRRKTGRRQNARGGGDELNKNHLYFFIFLVISYSQILPKWTTFMTLFGSDFGF